MTQLQLVQQQVEALIKEVSEEAERDERRLSDPTDPLNVIALRNGIPRHIPRRVLTYASA